MSEEVKIPQREKQLWHILDMKTKWESIKHMPYERKEVRYNFLVEPVAKKGGLDKKKMLIFDENSFRKMGFRINGNAVFQKNTPIGLLVDIIRAKEFLANLKRERKMIQEKKVEREKGYFHEDFPEEEEYEGHLSLIFSKMANKKNETNIDVYPENITNQKRIAKRLIGFCEQVVRNHLHAYLGVGMSEEEAKKAALE